MNKTILAAVAAAALSATSASAQSVHQDWTAVKEGDRCWASTAPDPAGAGIPGRESPRLSILNYPPEGVRDSVAVVAGFEIGEGSVSLAVNGEAYDVLPFGDAAFAASGRPEAALVAAMRAGRELVVTWSDAEGRSATDRYSLMGFTAARAEIARLCR